METNSKILIIDDDADIGMMIKMMFEFSGYDVILLESGNEAVKIAKNEPISLIITDMLIAGTNGIDICNTLKNDSLSSHIPVIMMSAHPDAQKICLEAGADDFIPKPFDMHELLSKCNRLVNQSAISKND